MYILTKNNLIPLPLVLHRQHIFLKHPVQNKWRSILYEQLQLIQYVLRYVPNFPSSAEGFGQEEPYPGPVC